MVISRTASRVIDYVNGDELKRDFSI